MMIRKQIFIQPEQAQWLKTLTQVKGISESALIRQALAAYFSGGAAFQRDLSAWEREQVFIESLIERGPVEGERTWKRSDLY